MDNEQKVVVACPKCGQKLRCDAGGVGTCPKCGERVSFTSKSFSSDYLEKKKSNNDKIGLKPAYKCPHCGNIQYEDSETCNKCGKNLIRHIKLSGIYYISLAASIMFCLFGIFGDTTNRGLYVFIGFIFFLIFFLRLLFCKHFDGKKIYFSTDVAAVYLPNASFSDSIGIQDFERDDYGTIFLDKQQKCFIIKNEKKKLERILPFSQIENFEIRVEHIEKEKSVLGRSVAGYAIAGPVGAAVGAASGVGTKKQSKLYLYISYNPRSYQSVVKSISLYITHISQDFYSDGRIILGLDSPLTPNSEIRQKDYL